MAVGSNFALKSLGTGCSLFTPTGLLLSPTLRDTQGICLEEGTLLKLGACTLWNVTPTTCVHLLVTSTVFGIFPTSPSSCHPSQSPPTFFGDVSPFLLQKLAAKGTSPCSVRWRFCLAIAPSQATKSSVANPAVCRKTRPTWMIEPSHCHLHHHCQGRTMTSYKKCCSPLPCHPPSFLREIWSPPTQHPPYFHKKIWSLPSQYPPSFYRKTWSSRTQHTPFFHRKIWSLPTHHPFSFCRKIWSPPTQHPPFLHGKIWSPLTHYPPSSFRLLSMAQVPKPQRSILKSML